MSLPDRPGWFSPGDQLQMARQRVAYAEEAIKRDRKELIDAKKQLRKLERKYGKANP